MPGRDDLGGAPRDARAADSEHRAGSVRVVRRTPQGTYVLAESPEGEAGEEFVIGPGGLRRKSHARRVEPGMIVDLSEGRIRVLDRARRVIADFGKADPRPGNLPAMPRGVVRPLEQTATLRTDEPPAPEPFGSGWITYGSWLNNSGDTVTSFLTSWVVPPPPATQSGQKVFLFSGMQNATGILQPVLQWGGSVGGGGNSWAIGSFFVDTTHGVILFSSLANVNPGNVVTGLITKTGVGTTGLHYNCHFVGFPGTSLDVENVTELFWLVQTLEAYTITRCSDYPNTDKTAMQSIDVRTGDSSPTVFWSPTVRVIDCGQHTQMFNHDSAGSGEVDLWYRPGPYWTAGSASIAPGAEQVWQFSWDGDGDRGPQLIQAQPLNASAGLVTTEITERRDANGRLTYHATVRNEGPNIVNFQWRGGGR